VVSRFSRIVYRASALFLHISEGSLWLCPFGSRLLNGKRDLASVTIGERHRTYFRKMVLLTDLPMFPSLKWPRFQTSRANIHRRKVNMLCDLCRHRIPGYQPLPHPPTEQVRTLSPSFKSRELHSHHGACQCQRPICVDILRPHRNQMKDAAKYARPLRPPHPVPQCGWSPRKEDHWFCDCGCPRMARGMCARSSVGTRQWFAPA